MGKLGNRETGVETRISEDTDRFAVEITIRAVENPRL